MRRLPERPAGCSSTMPSPYRSPESRQPYSYLPNGPLSSGVGSGGSAAAAALGPSFASGASGGEGMFGPSGGSGGTGDSGGSWGLLGDFVWQDSNENGV